jgi:hypothetical protein
MASSRLLEEYQIKLDRYALLAAIAEKQFLDGWRPVAPLVLPVVLTTHGEFCPGAIELQEWLVEKYRLRLLLEGPRDDGEKPEHLTACFRRELRASLLVAMILGTSAILSAAGLPKGLKPRVSVIAPPSRPDPPSPASAQDGLEDEDGEIVDNDGGDESDSGNSSTSSSDNDSVHGTPSAAPRRSARIAQHSGVGQQPPTASMAFAHFSLNIAEGFPIVSALHLHSSSVFISSLG